MPQPLRVTLLIGSALASLCMEVPPRCRPACVRSRTDFLRTAAAVVGASSLSLCAQGPAVAASPAEERSPALLAFDQMQAAGRGHTCTLPHMCSCAPWLACGGRHGVASLICTCGAGTHRPARTRGQARNQPAREVVIYKPPSVKTKSTARELKLAKHLKASGASMCARCLPALPSRPSALPAWLATWLATTWLALPSSHTTPRHTPRHTCSVPYL